MVLPVYVIDATYKHVVELVSDLRALRNIKVASMSNQVCTSLLNSCRIARVVDFGSSYPFQNVNFTSIHQCAFTVAIYSFNLIIIITMFSFSGKNTATSFTKLHATEHLFLGNNLSIAKLKTASTPFFPSGGTNDEHSI